MNRRHFAKLAFLSSLSLSSKKGQADYNHPAWTRPLSVHLFSKHLQFLDYPQMAKVAADLGFDGVDLTVRPGGHVEPEKVEEDLPKAAEALSDRGLLSLMMTTAVTNVNDPLNLNVINTAVDQGIRYYRMGYYKFEEDKTWKENLDRCKRDIEGLASLHEEHGIHGAYQNHAGTGVGAYITDVVYLLEGLNPLWTGCQYDIRHAVVDGGLAWGNGVKWLKDSISTIAVKDFTWAKHPQTGKYSIMHTPLGDGMVDFVGYFKLLRQLEIHPVVTLHCEYDLGGANYGSRELTIPKRKVYKAIKKDLTVLLDLWQKSAEV